MRLSNSIKTQLAVFVTVAAVASSTMLVEYIRVPALVGLGHYTVTIELPRTGGLYERANVTYRGTEVGRVKSVRLADSGVEAVLSLRSDVAIPSDVDAEVHSASAVGEQYVALLPRSADAPPLKDGDVIDAEHTSVPPDINALLTAVNEGLEAIPRDDVRTVIDESYVAVGGLGPEMARIVRGSTRVAIDARANLDPLLALIDHAKPVLDSQGDTADAIHSWAAHLADLTGQLSSSDTDLRQLLAAGPRAADEARQLIDRVKPTVPVLLANLASVGQVALTYNPALEQILVLLPQGVAIMQTVLMPNRDTDHPGMYLDFNLNLNLPPPCSTGYLPIQQQRAPTFVDTPDQPGGDLYCRIPQDSWVAVRGARNYPCLTKPGKRAPTAAMCKSDENYVPLNDGFNWKGDPNATLSGQDIPQQRHDASVASEPPPIAAAHYDPQTGTYRGPDGRLYVESGLAPAAGRESWQSMLLPP